MGFDYRPSETLCFYPEFLIPLIGFHLVIGMPGQAWHTSLEEAFTGLRLPPHPP